MVGSSCPSISSFKRLDNHHTAWVLAGGALHPGTALSQTVFLRPRGIAAPLLHVFFHIAEGRLFRHGADGPRPEHMGLTKELKGVPVGAGLIFAGKIQVDVGHLVAAEAQERLKGDMKPVLGVLGPAYGAHRVRHIRPAARPQLLGGVKIRVLAVGAAVVGRQGVHLGDPRHEGHQRGTEPTR